MAQTSGGAVDLTAVRDRASFGAALSRLRASRDLSVRDLARLARQPVSTVGDWCSGRSLPQRSQRAAVLAVLTACGVAADDVPAWVTALERARGTTAVAVRADVAPYRGLLPYEAADAGWFFGRDRLTARLRERVAVAAAATGEQRVLAVVGSSGSGKSSVLRAGLVPTVALGGPGVDSPGTGTGTGTGTGWIVEVMTPGEDPRGALASRPSAAGGAGGPTLLVVDQFEEVFSPAVDETTRRAFLDDLFAVVDTAASSTVVVLGMRADFYDRATADARLARVLQDGQVVVAPMGESELRAAIVEPARHADVVVDPDLVERLLREMGVTGAGGRADAGTLPLLSHALRATWERSTGPRLTMADYDATGGVGGSIEQSAEEVFTALDGAGQEFARQLFTQLVRVDEATGTVTRRALDPADLPGGAGDDPTATTAATVLDAFIARRLLTVDAGTVGISHERLLTAWPRIGEWLEADRDTLRAHHQLADAVRAWQAGGRDPAFLLTGTRLAAAADLRGAAVLTGAERELVDASVDAVQADRRRQRRRLRRTRQLLALVAVLALVASGAGIAAFRAARATDQARQREEVAGRAALSPLVAINARQVAERDPALAQQLAVVAWRTAPSAEARSALLDLARPAVISRLVGGSGPTAVAVSPDGATLAVSDGANGAVRLYALHDGRAPAPGPVIPGRTGTQVFAMVWSGPVLAIGSTAGTVTRWDTAAGRPVELGTLDRPFARAVEGIAVSPDGRLLAAVSDGDQPVRVWDVSSPSARFVAGPSGVAPSSTEQTVAFSPDGTRLLAGGTGGTLYAWPTSDLTGSAPTVVQSNSTQTMNTMRFDPSGRSLYTASRAGTVEVRDATTLQLLTSHQLPDTGWATVLAFSPDGREVAVGTSDGALERFGTSPWVARATTPNPGPVTGLAYTPDGRSLASGVADGTARVVGVEDPVAVGDGLAVFSLSFDGTGRHLAVATSGAGATAQLWDLADPTRTEPESSAFTVPDLTGTGALRPDGTLLATGSRDGAVRLWDTRVPTAPVQVGGAFPGATALVETLAFSPDGRVLAVGSDDNTLRLWDVRDPAAPRALGVMTTGSYVVGAAFSPDGTQVAAASIDQHAYVWDVHDPSRPRQRAELGGFANYVWGVAWSPDGRLLAATSADQTTRLWDVTGNGTPKPTATLTGPKGYNIAAAFSPDSRELAVGSHDENVWMYDVSAPSRPRTLATLTDVGGNVNTVAFAPDGRLVAGGYSTSVPLWDTDADAVAADVCAAAGSAITREEWAQYVPGAAYDPPCR